KPWKRGRTDTNLPLGPSGMPCVQSFSATGGLSRLATAQALGGLNMNAVLPATRASLLEALSQAPTSGGRNWVSLFKYSRAWRTGSDFTVILPLASTISAPKARKKAPSHSTLSVVTPSGKPKENPALWHFSAAPRKASQVQASAALVGWARAGYIGRMSIPACCVIRS